jgi:hypothetical protein
VKKKLLTNPPAPRDDTPIVSFEIGHGRFCVWTPKDHSSATIVFYTTPDYTEPGKKFSLDEDQTKWEPRFGIQLDDAGSAEAWSRAFKGMATHMRKLKKANDISKIEAVDIRTDSSEV